VRVEVGADRQALASWLGDDELPVKVRESPHGLLAVAIDTAGGEIVLR
jgi:hypothetical protein